MAANFTVSTRLHRIPHESRYPDREGTHMQMSVLASPAEWMGSPRHPPTQGMEQTDCRMRPTPAASSSKSSRVHRRRNKSHGVPVVRSVLARRIASLNVHGGLPDWVIDRGSRAFPSFVRAWRWRWAWLACGCHGATLCKRPLSQGSVCLSWRRRG
jgi:hypothetical protein